METKATCRWLEAESSSWSMRCDRCMHEGDLPDVSLGTMLFWCDDLAVGTQTWDGQGAFCKNRKVCARCEIALLVPSSGLLAVGREESLAAVKNLKKHRLKLRKPMAVSWSASVAVGAGSWS